MEELLIDTSTPFKRTVKQKEATKVLAKYKHAMLYGGSRSGKTFITIRSIMIRAIKYEDSRHLIIRKAFNHVKQSILMDTLPKVMKLCFPTIPYNLNKSDWFVTLPNGSEIWFGGTDDKERVEKILGNEYSTIYANECSQISYDAIVLIRTRLAQKVEGMKNRFWYDCNPPSRKHWTYQYFVEGRDPTSREKLTSTKNIGFLKMNPEDNLENVSEDYLQELKNLPKKQRERFLQGVFGNDIEGALWTQEMISVARSIDEHWKLMRTVIGVDPATTDGEQSDEWGICAASTFADKKYSVDGDYTRRASPNEAIKKVIEVYEHHEADAIIVETNQGGKMIEELLRNAGYSGRVINVHASKSKFSRAEPISALYEQGLVRHAFGLDLLEDEMTQFSPFEALKSPNRMDAMVWALHELSQAQLVAGGF